jgi:serine protease
MNPPGDGIPVTADGGSEHIMGFIVKYREHSPAARGHVPTATALLPDLATLHGIIDGIWIERPMGLRRMVIHTDPPANTIGNRGAQAVMRALAAHWDVESVEADLLVVPEDSSPTTPRDIPTPPGWNYQWNLHPTILWPGGIDVKPAWKAGLDGTGIRIAVIDSGIDFHHPELRPRLEYFPNSQDPKGYTFLSKFNGTLTVNNRRDVRGRGGNDEGNWTDVGDCGPNKPQQFTPSSWHGTHVAGIAAATGIVLAGVAPQATIVPVRVLGPGHGLTSDVVHGILWAAGFDDKDIPGLPVNDVIPRVDVINLSLGGTNFDNTTKQYKLNPCDHNSAYYEAIKKAIDRRVVVVIAAGNDGIDAKSYVQPANCDVKDKMVVGAFARDGKRSSYSNYSNDKDLISVSAPGGGGLRQIDNSPVSSSVNPGTRGPEPAPSMPNTSMINNPWYKGKQGTSMAAPHVSGLAALLIQHLQRQTFSPTPNEIKTQITGNVTPIPSGQCPPPRLCGSGLINVPKTLGLSK